MGICISSVPRQNSTFLDVNFELFIPPLSPKFMKKKIKRKFRIEKERKLIGKKGVEEMETDKKGKVL